jgi:hypothetical protein
LLAYFIGQTIQAVSSSAKKSRLKNYVEQRQARRVHDRNEESRLSKF